MKYIRRLIYLGYYMKQTNRSRYSKFMNYVHHQTGISKLRLVADSIYSSVIYNVSLLEYFMFRFWEKDATQRQEWAGTGFMYEYQLKMNPKSTRETLLNKAKFLRHNSAFIEHKWIYINDGDWTKLYNFLLCVKGKVVLKSVDGNCGIGVKVVDMRTTAVENVVDMATKNNLRLVEEYIYQHKDLMALSPSALNTVRIFTQIEDDKVVILGCRLRISINSDVDNMAAGNMAAAINTTTGALTSKGVYSDITKQPEAIHPVTRVPIVGFQLPHWDMVIKKVSAIALHNRENRSVGWDIAITDSGVDFIEGNHDWCKLVYQLPVAEGLKKELQIYV